MLFHIEMMKTIVALLLYIALFVADVDCDERDPSRIHIIEKRASEKCHGSFTLCQGKSIPVETPQKTLKQEVEANPNSKLAEAYNEMMSGTSKARFQKVLQYGRAKQLDDEQIQAVFMYTIDSIFFHKDFNKALREGTDKYPVFHYLLDSALKKKLPKTSSPLYRGYRKIVNVSINTVLSLPGFTSTSTDETVARDFSAPGCTVLQFDMSKEGASIVELSRFPKESEVLVPPTEKFQIYDTATKDGYEYVYLKPASARRKRSEQDYMLCSTGSNSYYEMLNVLIVILTGSFLL